MSDLLRKPKGSSGKVHDITPADAGWGYVSPVEQAFPIDGAV